MREPLPILVLIITLQPCLELFYDSSDWHAGECIKETALSTPTGVQLPFLGLSDAQPAEMRAVSFHHMSPSCTTLFPKLSATAQDHIETWCLAYNAVNGSLRCFSFVQDNKRNG